MQQLLQMMKKISAEPNNNARLQTSQLSQEITSSDEEQSVSIPEVGADIESDIRIDADTDTEDKAGITADANTVDADIENLDNPEPTAEQQEQSAVKLPTTTNEDVTDEASHALVATDNDGRQSESHEVVIDRVVAKKGGVIKRWINKALSWVKRLVGF